jgi:hypothetical protein
LMCKRCRDNRILVATTPLGLLTARLNPPLSPPNLRGQHACQGSGCFAAKMREKKVNF